MWIVLDDEEDGVARLDVHAIVRDWLDGPLRHDMQARGLGYGGCSAARGLAMDCRTRADIFDRQIERKGRAAVGRRAQMDFAAEQARQFAADRPPKAGAAIFAAGRR